jgi:hypothetical protein
MGHPLYRNTRPDCHLARFQELDSMGFKGLADGFRAAVLQPALFSFEAAYRGEGHPGHFRKVTNPKTQSVPGHSKL